MKPLDRRSFLKAAGASVLAASALPEGAAVATDAAPASRPNILVFLTDDHGQWAQRPYGNAELRTPNLDRLSARGMRMTRAFTPCPVCSPARASFFTGLTPSQHGIHDWLEERETAYVHPGLKGQSTIAQTLQAAGYQTGLVGKWHCGYERQPQPGFERWFSYWVSQYPHRGLQRFSDQGAELHEEGQQSPLLTKRAVEFIRARKEKKETRPFFLVVGYVDTHAPYTLHQEELVDPYRQTATFKDIPDEPFLDVHGKVRTGRPKDPKVEREHRSQYYGAVESIDQQVGAVLAELEATGQLDDTLIVYTGDHGLNCGQHGVWNKGNATQPQNFLEESIKIPCLVSWPKGGIAQGSSSEAMVDHCDLHQTLLEAAGAALDEAARAKRNPPGKSYLPILRGQKPAWRDAQFCEYGNARMVRTDRYKLILRYPYKGVTHPSELYDLQADPRETKNVYDDPASAAIVKELTAAIDRYFAKYTVAERDGLKLEELPPCNRNASPWVEKPARG